MNWWQNRKKRIKRLDNEILARSATLNTLNDMEAKASGAYEASSKEMLRVRAKIEERLIELNRIEKCIRDRNLEWIYE